MGAAGSARQAPTDAMGSASRVLDALVGRCCCQRRGGGTPLPLLMSSSLVCRWRHAGAHNIGRKPEKQDM